MSTIKFNYQTEKFDEAIGLSTTDLHALGDKLADKSIELITQQHTPGIIAEWIANNISYKEMLFLVVKQVFEKASEAVHSYDQEKSSGLPPEIADLMKFLESKSSISRTDPETGSSFHAINIEDLLKKENKGDVKGIDSLINFLKKMTGEKKSPKSGPHSFEELKKMIEDKKNNKKDPEKDE